MFTWYGTRQLESAVHLDKSSWKNLDFLDYVLPLLVIDTLPLAAVVLRALRFSRTCMVRDICSWSALPRKYCLSSTTKGFPTTTSMRIMALLGGGAGGPLRVDRESKYLR